MRGVLLAALVAVVVCAFSGLVLDAVTEPAYAIVGSVVLGLAAFLLTGLLIDVFWYDR